MPGFDFDLFVIGAGSGGVRAARVSAGHGARVAIAEEFRVGGTCVIRGCVPKKLLVYGAHFAEDLQDARRFGWEVSQSRFDWTVLRDNVQAETRRLEGIYQDTLDKAGVVRFGERAIVRGPHEVELASGRRVSARLILIATGAVPRMPDCPGAEHGITSNEVFELARIPQRVVIVGGGYIAMEFGGIFNKLGSKVTFVNRSGEILRHYDVAIRQRLIAISQTKGIEFRFHAQIESVAQDPAGGITARIADQAPIDADLIVFALGRQPNSMGLGLDEVGVHKDAAGAVMVDEDNRSTVPSIFAVGDVTNRVQLTPVAIREGHAFADSQFGSTPRRVNYEYIPTAVFSHPPIAAVGYTEDRARAAFSKIRVYSSDFRPMKNVLAGREERCLYKLITDAETDRVIGLHMIGPEAPEILQAAAVAVKSGLTKADFNETVALHPTMSEELVLFREV
jgi:glutathione reductase (NADPH)